MTPDVVTLVQAGLGSLVAWESVRLAGGYRLPAFLKPVAVALLAAGLLACPYPLVLHAASCAGLVSLLRRVISGPELTAPPQPQVVRLPTRRPGELPDLV